MKKPVTWHCIVATVILSGCAAAPGVSVPPGSTGGNSAEQTTSGQQQQRQEEARTPYNGYEPIDAVTTPTVFTYDTPTEGSPKLWSTMNAATVRSLLPNQTSTTTIKKFTADGKLQYLSAATTAEGSYYEVIMDYAKSRSEPVYETTASGNGGSGSQGKLLGYGKVGVGVRIKVNIVSLKSGVDLNGLIGLAIAARQNSIRGTIAVDVIGIDSKGVNSLLPVGVQLDESSIQSTLQSLATIQTRIYDSDVTLTPHLISIRRGEPIVGAVDANKDQEKASIIQGVQGAPQQQQQQIQQRQLQQQQQQLQR